MILVLASVDAQLGQTLGGLNSGGTNSLGINSVRGTNPLAGITSLKGTNPLGSITSLKGTNPLGGINSIKGTNPVGGTNSGAINPLFNPARTPESRRTTTETTVTEDSTTTDSNIVTDESITDKTEIQEPTDRTTKSPNPTQSTNPGWELKGKNPEDLTSIGMMDPKYREMEMHEKKMKSKKEDMAAVEKSIGDLEEKMMMQAFQFVFGFILHNMNVIMEQIEPAVLRFNSMLERYACFQIFN